MLPGKHSTNDYIHNIRPTWEFHDFIITNSL